MTGNAAVLSRPARHVLWLATKAPWPPVDGGRLLMSRTFEALAAAGHRITVVAPYDPRRAGPPSIPPSLATAVEARWVPARPRPLALAWLTARRRGWPSTVARHHHPALTRAAVDVVGRAALAPAGQAPQPIDVVMVEQAQAVSNVPRAWLAGPASPTRPPVVFRAQNVESDLWRLASTAASLRPAWLRRPILEAEARRLARWEGGCVRRCAASVALTREDAARLGDLAGSPSSGGAVDPDHLPTVVPAPFPARLPVGETALPGDPAVVVLGSAGWLPNRDGARWFLDQVWPRLHAERPGAVLHLIGGVEPGAGPGSSGVVVHPAPRDSREAFAPGAVLAVPLLQASGVRMKILEAWARGLPVVATGAAARGLEAPREALLVTDEPTAMAAEIIRLATDPALRERLRSAGRAALETSYADSTVAAALAAVWDRVCTSSCNGVGAVAPSISTR